MHRFEDVEGADGEAEEWSTYTSTHMSKIEGHGKLDIKIKGGKVELRQSSR